MSIPPRKHGSNKRTASNSILNWGLFFLKNVLLLMMIVNTRINPERIRVGREIQIIVTVADDLSIHLADFDGIYA
jgi:hypothetical protein